MQRSLSDSSNSSAQTSCVRTFQPGRTLRPSRTGQSQMTNCARWIIVGVLPLWCALGAASAQAEDSDFFKLTLTNKDTGDVITTTSNAISEFDEISTGKNLKLDSITVPINDFFGDPTTTPPVHSDDLVISTINGIMRSDVGREPDSDKTETVTLWSFDITFMSGESDSLMVNGVTTPAAESGSIMLSAKHFAPRTFGDLGDEVDLNSFTISFTSDAKPNEEPPAGTNDPVDGRSYSLKIEAVSDGASVPEPSIWAMMLLGFAGLGFAAFRRSMKQTMGSA
jgi:hypothetical protein